MATKLPKSVYLLVEKKSSNFVIFFKEKPLSNSLTINKSESLSMELTAGRFQKAIRELYGLHVAREFKQHHSLRRFAMFYKYLPHSVLLKISVVSILYSTCTEDAW